MAALTPRPRARTSGRNTTRWPCACGRRLALCRCLLLTRAPRAFSCAGQPKHGSVDPPKHRCLRAGALLALHMRVRALPPDSRNRPFASQRGDIEGALALFRRAKTEVLGCAGRPRSFTRAESADVSCVSQGTSMQVHTYNVILHLCSGGNQQGEAATRVHPAETAEVRLRVAADCLGMVQVICGRIELKGSVPAPGVRAHASQGSAADGDDVHRDGARRRR